jgi:hypothetical protein
VGRAQQCFRTGDLAAHPDTKTRLAGASAASVLALHDGRLPRFGFAPALKDVADVLALAHRKGDDRIMHIMSRPRAARIGEDPKGLYWFDDSEHREALYAYCCGDVACERDLWRWLSC